MINALEVAGKKLEEATIVTLGAGAAAVACMKLLLNMGAKVENIFMLDRKGVIHSGREDLSTEKAIFATETDKRTLDDAIEGADVFVGLSGPNLLSADQLKKWRLLRSCLLVQTLIQKFIQILLTQREMMSLWQPAVLTSLIR